MSCRSARRLLARCLPESCGPLLRWHSRRERVAWQPCITLCNGAWSSPGGRGVDEMKKDLDSTRRPLGGVDCIFCGKEITFPTHVNREIGTYILRCQHCGNGMIRDVATFVKMNPLTKAHTALTEFPYRTLLLRRLVRSLSSRRALGICAFTAADEICNTFAVSLVESCSMTRDSADEARIRGRRPALMSHT
jgi:hypothetical protein